MNQGLAIRIVFLNYNSAIFCKIDVRFTVTKFVVKLSVILKSLV